MVVTSVVLMRVMGMVSVRRCLETLVATEVLVQVMQTGWPIHC